MTILLLMLLAVYSPVFVGPGQNFFNEAAHIWFIKFFICRIIEPLDESFHEPEDSATGETTKKHERAICWLGTDRLFNFKRHLKVHADAPNETCVWLVCSDISSKRAVVTFELHLILYGR